MTNRHVRTAGLAAALTVATLWCSAVSALQTLSVDHQQVRRWNRFAEALLERHHRQLESRRVIRSERIGGYAGRPGFYRELRFVDVASGRLLSVLRWERDDPTALHGIEVYEYGPDGRVLRDYLADYLPVHRNAPIQTLVNVHNYRDGLHAFRQFDASGVRIYEQCRGEWRGEQVIVSLEQDELPINTGAVPEQVGEALYASCFDGLPEDVDAHLADLLAEPDDAVDDEREAMAFKLELLDGMITIEPDDARLYVDRGLLHFRLHDFDQAVKDLGRAIELDDSLDPAWFWRGMARGRAGDVAGAVADLGVYLARNPDDAVAYTKRGVRYIWLGDLDSARSDLEKAVALDPGNAEAHDDLGVVHARQQRYQAARHHFREAIAHDPSYQKAHHNLAMMLYLAGEHQAALQRVERALELDPDSRNGMLLKAAILRAQGRESEARAISEQAEFLPEGNWSERLPVQ